MFDPIIVVRIFAHYLAFFWSVLDIYIYFYVSAAGDAFCRAASVQSKLESRHEAATQYVEAGNCFKKADPNGNY